MSGWASLLGAGGTSGISSGVSATSGSSGGWMSAIGSLFGGSSGSSMGSSSNMWGNIFQGMLGGLGAMASGGGEKGLSVGEQIGLIQQQSHEQRRNIGFTADMEDYYKQKDKVRRRAALDTYGQFSLLSRYAPNYTAAPPVDPGVRPST